MGCGAASSYCAQPVAANVSHFEPGLPSASLEATSFGGFSAEAVTFDTCGSRLPGTLRSPLRFCDSPVPASAGTASPASKDDWNVTSPGAAAAEIGVSTAA